MINLPKRLQALLDEIPAGARVADIGCDHGKLAVASILSGKAIQCTACDISEKSLEKAKILAKKHDIFEKMQFFHCDGLACITPEIADTIVIAGMGGHNIKDIIGACPHTFKKYILMPHRNPEVVREILLAKNLQIKEYTVLDGGRNYIVIVGDLL